VIVIGTKQAVFRLGVALAVLGLAAPALAQNQMIIDRGLTDDVPYTIIYPDVLQGTDDGNPDTVISLRHPQAAVACDAFVVQGGAEGWSAQAASDSLDVAGIEESWRPNFEGFTITGQGITNFASGPALLYEALADSSPFGVPVSVVHAEAVDGGRTYALECVLDRAVAAEARPMIDFLIANFSTRSDGQCCIDPSDQRG
jgi:hypothetical protein